MEINGVPQAHIDGLACLILGIQHDFRVYHRDDASHHEDENQVIYAHCKEPKYHTRNHFLSLNLIKKDSCQCSKDNGQDRCNDARQYDSF